jgi:hypothetical protein
MRTFRQAVLITALAALLMGCATEGNYRAHPVAYAGNIFYCASYPSYGIDCPGGFYYNNFFFPDRYAFFTHYHIDRRHWKDFHGRRYWGRDDWERTEAGDSRQWQRHRLGKKATGGTIGTTVAQPESHGIPDRELDATNGRQPPLSNEQWAFPGNRAFGPGNSIRALPHGLWRHRD